MSFVHIYPFFVFKTYNFLYSSHTITIIKFIVKKENNQRLMMNHITNHVSQILQDCNQEHYWKFLIMSKWTEIMGSLAGKVSIHKIHQNTVILGVCDSSWMQELHLLSELIKEKINQILGDNRIESIKLKYVAPTKKTTQKKAASAQQPCVDRTLTKQELEALEKIEDKELSQALIGFLKKCHQPS